MTSGNDTRLNKVNIWRTQLISIAPYALYLVPCQVAPSRPSPSFKFLAPFMYSIAYRPLTNDLELDAEGRLAGAVLQKQRVGACV